MIFFSFLEFFKLEKTGMTEDSVFPEPVGAITRQSFFCKITGDAFFCISVNLENPKCANNKSRLFVFDSILFSNFISKHQRLENTNYNKC